jgi:hypothetical protein
MQNERDWTASIAITSRIEQGAELETVIQRDGTPDAGLVVMNMDGRRKMLRVRNAFGSYPQVREALRSEAEYHVREYAPEMFEEFFAEETPDGRTKRVPAAPGTLEVSPDEIPAQRQHAETVPQTEDETPANVQPVVDDSPRASGTEEKSSTAEAGTTTDESYVRDEEDPATVRRARQSKKGDGKEKHHASEADDPVSEETVDEDAHAGASETPDAPNKPEDAYGELEGAGDRIECDQERVADSESVEDNGKSEDAEDGYAQMGGILASLMS